MFVKKRNSLSDANEIKRGSLIKSPPSYIFNNRSSWKVRLFKLFQTRDNKFILSYYEPDGVSEKMKGTIKIRNIKSIKKEYNSENVSAILRSFNISHHKVIHVKTEDRDFYLCDEIEEELDDWYECLTNAWIKENTSMDISGPKILHPKPPSASSETLNDDRPKSYPENYPKSGNQLAEANERERSHTDPGVICKPSPTASQQQKIECTDRSTIPLPDHPQPVKLNTKCSARPPPLQQTRRGHSSQSFEETIPEADNVSETESEENKYDVPRRLFQRRDASPESGCQSDGADDSEIEDNVYVDMKSVSLNSGLPRGPPSLPRKGLKSYELFDRVIQNPDSSKNAGITQSAEPAKDSLTEEEEEKLSLYTKEASVPNEQKESPKSVGSQLNKIYLIRLIYEKQNQDDLVEVEISMLKEHLKNFLTVLEVGEYLCVSKWNGPKEIGCRFYHGDHIKAVNDIRLKTNDLYTELLENSLSDQVRLTVVRNPKAEVFHTEGCRCKNS